jgi:hypothetical protein
MRRPRPLLTVLAAALLTACAEFDLKTDYEPGTDFYSLKTYSWMAPLSRPTDDLLLVANTLLDQRVRMAGNRALAEKGFILSEGKDADFQVRWAAGIKQRLRNDPSLNTRDIPGTGPYQVGSITQHLVPYEEGSLVIDIVGKDGKSILWRAIVKAEIFNDTPPEQTRKLVMDAVSAALGDFPPKKK